MLQMTTQQIDDRETVDGWKQSLNWPTAMPARPVRWPSLRSIVNWLSIAPGPVLPASISRMAPFKDGKAHPATADIGNRLPPINLPLAVPSVVSAEVGSSALE